MELAKIELTIETMRPVEMIVPQTDEEKELVDSLCAYPPTYKENDPP